MLIFDESIKILPEDNRLAIFTFTLLCIDVNFMGTKNFSLLILFLLPLAVVSQELNNMRKASLVLLNDTIQLDSLSITPGSLKVFDADGNTVDDSLFRVDYLKGLMIIDSSLLNKPGYSADFRVFPLNFYQIYQNKDTSWIQKEGINITGQFKSATQPGGEDDFFRSDGLNKSGSIARGVYIGSNQDLSVNSNLNLQLSGRLGPEVDILAAITDNNVPLQPYGNTQVVQEFDKVFIQLSMKKSTLIAGDFELPRPDSYFMNFYKKLQGGKFSSSFTPGKNKTGFPIYDITASAALSKGKYSRNYFQGIEGNQGPYYLKGNEGESFIIVLSGTEKVHIDGKLLTRGEKMDYIIDYNAATLTFTPNVLITKDSRIEVEFEYSDKNYARSLLFLGNELKYNRLKVGLNIYSEQDLKNQSLVTDLTDEEENTLAGKGGEQTYAYLPWIDSIGYVEGEILYRMTDTLVADVLYDSVFIFSRNPDSAEYRVGFSNVGTNKGNYILSNTIENTRIYKWVAPVSGIPQGSYEPVKLVITPKKRQMITLGSSYEFDENSKVFVELAMSNSNQNTFSGRSEDEQGFSLKTKVNKDFLFSENWKINTSGDYEWISATFEAIERFRQVEFNRDWNITDSLPGEDQHLFTASAGIGRKELGSLNYVFQGFFVGQDFQAIRNVIDFGIARKGYEATISGDLLNTRQWQENTRFLRQKAKLIRKFSTLSLGVKQEQENNRFYDSADDSLKTRSYSYLQWEAFIQSPDSSEKSIFRLTYRERHDKNATVNELKKSGVASNMEGMFGYLKNPSNRITLSIAYRNLRVMDTLLMLQQPEQTLIGRVEHYLRILKGVVTFSTFYEPGSGNEQKLEFYYLKVPAGEGVYTWNDYNMDGVEQLDEFEIAVFKDQANYIRVYVKSDVYVNTYTGKFTESALLSPAIAWKGKDGLKGILARFSDQFVYRTEKKSSQEYPRLAFNPFLARSATSDTALTGMNNSLRNTFYYNKANPKFNADYNYQVNRLKNLLVSGFETRDQISQQINVRWNVYQTLTLLCKYSWGKNLRASDLSSNYNYNIFNHEINPVLSFQPTTSLKADLQYTYYSRADRYPGSDLKARGHNAGSKVNFKIVNKGNINIDIQYYRIDFNGEDNTPLAYEMLNGLKSGNNTTWSLSFQQNLAKFLQIDLTYEGRKSQGLGAIHTGSVQLRAHF